MRKIDDFYMTEFIPTSNYWKYHMLYCREKVFGLTSKNGSLGIPILKEISNLEYENSKLLTETLGNKIIHQDGRYQSGEEIKNIKNQITSARLPRNKLTLQSLRDNMNKQQKWSNYINPERSSSSSVTTAINPERSSSSSVQPPLIQKEALQARWQPPLIQKEALQAR